MALVSAAYARLLPHLWQEMLMEHVGIVKWAHHKIVWPSQGFERRAVIFFDITARTLLDCVSTYSIMDFPRLISAASSLGLHCLAKYSSQVLRKESKIDERVSVAVNMHSLFQKFTNICQIHVKSGQSYLQSHWKESSVVRYVCGNFCYWYHVAQYYLLQLGRCSLLSEEEDSSGCCLVFKTRLACS